MFLQVCVILFTGGSTWPPWDLLHTPGPGTPRLGTRYTPLGPGAPPWDQVHPPGTRYTPLAPGTPPWVHPQDKVHPPGPGTPPSPPSPPRPGTPPGTRYTPGDKVHPQDQVHPPPHSMLRDTVNTWVVHILLECNLVSQVSVILLRGEWGLCNHYPW